MHRLKALLALPFLAHAEPRPAKESPWNADLSHQLVDLSQFRLPADLEITVWATSPHLYNPTNIDIDHAGRIWVAEGVNYRRHSGRRPGGDRIAVLQDTDGDGKADTSHTFVQEKNLVAPLGVAVFDNKIYVSQPPELLVYTDVNRDLKFDPAIDKREVLLTGFNAKNHDHSLHSVTAGPDGKLYFNNGNCGAVFQDNSGKNFYLGGPYKGGGGQWPVDHRAVSGKRSDDGHVWTSGFTVRMNPDGTHCEIVGHGYRNSYEQSLDSFGNPFQNDNDDPPACRVSYILEYGCATGVTMYENGALPESYNGSFFSCEPGRNTIFHYHPEPQGAAFKLEQKNLTTTNPDKKYAGSDFVGGGANPNDTKILFRPSDICVGPDGALYISDWYDPRVGGHSDRDDTCSGTIYRIAPKNFKPEIPKFDLTAVAGAITALKSPAINTRFLGFTALKEMGEKAIPELQELTRNPNPHLAARAIWLLAPFESQTATSCLAILNTDSNQQKRLTAYRALRRHYTDTNQPAPLIAMAENHANDPNPALRRDIALSLRNLPAAKTKHIFALLAAKVDHTDKNAIESIGLGAANQESEIWLAIKKAMNPGAPHEWSDQFAKLTWRLWPAAAVPDLQARAVHSSLTLAQRALAVESLAFIDDKSAAEAMLTLASKGPAKGEAARWLLRNANSEWKKFNIAGELKNRGIYDPAKVVVNPITAPAPAKPKFSVEDVLKLTGDPAKGTLTANRCVMCHQFNGIGADFGPNLKGWGEGQTLDVIAQSIINPSADIAHGYSGTGVRLKKGGEVHGIASSESDPIILTSTGGVTQMIPTDRITGRPFKLKHSLMLSADQLALTPQDVADLVAFLKDYK